MSSHDYLPPTSLYIHVPLCRSKCAYCDFYSRPGSELPPERVEGLVSAIIVRARELAARFGARGFDTVYVGGGTPSLLPRPSLASLLTSLAELSGRPREWTIEANPESLDREFLDIARAAGVNRLSLGVQSLDDELLALLGRPARAAESLKALELAAGSGLALSADLIAGLGRRGGLVAEAERLLDFGLGHLSVYDLVLEEGTALEARVRRGEVALLDEDEAADEREALEAFLTNRGLRRYEVSNYARPGAESLHNLAYWRMDSYLGAGPGAVSTLSARPISSAPPGRGCAALRIEELHSLEAYLEGRAAEVAREEPISPRDSAFELIMMSMRTSFGLERAAFKARFGLDIEALIGKSLEAWRERLVEVEGRLALDGRGLDILNRFLGDCLSELEANFPEPGSPA